jgi:hypothetical protein
MTINIPDWVLLAAAGAMLFVAGLLFGGALGRFTISDAEVIRRVQIMYEQDRGR